MSLRNTSIPRGTTNTVSARYTGRIQGQPEVSTAHLTQAYGWSTPAASPHTRMIATHRNPMPTHSLARFSIAALRLAQPAGLPIIPRLVGCARPAARPVSASRPVAGRPGNLAARHRAPPEAVLRQSSVPAGQVLLLDHYRRQRRGHLGVVGRLGLPLDPQGVGDPLGFLPRGVALPLGLGGHDLRLALRLDQLVALL